MKHFKYSCTSPNQLLLTPALPGTQAWFSAEQVSGVQSRARQTQPWFSEVAMSCEPEHLTNTSQNTVVFDKTTIQRCVELFSGLISPYRADALQPDLQRFVDGIPGGANKKLS